MKQETRVRLAAGLSVGLLTFAPLYILALTGTFISLAALGSSRDIAAWPWYLLIALAGVAVLAHLVFGIAAFADRKWVKQLRWALWLEVVLVAGAVVQALFLPGMNLWDVLTLASFLVLPLAVTAIVAWLAHGGEKRVLTDDSVSSQM